VRQTLYRILTENKNRQGVEIIVSKTFESYTILTGTGYWQSSREDCLAIEIVSMCTPELVKAVAEDIKRANRQQCVMVQSMPIESEMI
jgi:hypothetical protein